MFSLIKHNLDWDSNLQMMAVITVEAARPWARWMKIQSSYCTGSSMGHSPSTKLQAKTWLEDVWKLKPILSSIWTELQRLSDLCVYWMSIGSQSMKCLTKVFSSLSGDWRDSCYPDKKGILKKIESKLKGKRRSKAERVCEEEVGLITSNQGEIQPEIRKRWDDKEHFFNFTDSMNPRYSILR